MNKLVSICLPTYNGEKFLQESLSSIDQQTYKNLEVIISDDNSQDRTLEICRNFQVKSKFPVHIYSHTPAGIGANWNHCIEKANGAWIKLLFQDDVLAPDCIEKMMAAIEKHQLQIVVSERKLIDGNSDEIKEGAWYDNFHNLLKPAGIDTKEFYILSRHSLKNLKFKRYSGDNIVGEPCVSLFSKKLFNDIGPFNTQLKQILDYEYWLRVLEKYNIGIIPEKLVNFRYHEAQTSNINYNCGVREGDHIKEILYKKFLWHIDRKSRSNYFRMKYPVVGFLAGLKDRLLK